MGISVIITEDFERWLRAIGYAESTVYGSVRYLRDFLEWLEPTPIKEISQITPEVIRTYHNYLQQRANRRQGGSLSENYIVSNINALKRFSRYLQETGRATLEVDLQLRVIAMETKTILSMKEVRSLYRACGNDILGIRDRAILGIYYGCGLRRSEGLALNTSDIQLKEKRLYVRKGKNYRERYVPMTERVKEDLENYLYVAREKILSFKNIRQDALLLSMQVKPLCGNALINRIHKLAEAAGIEKETGLHTLRHSIATHLLQSGMTLEEVSQFLGHASLESTQIYTHVASEASAKEDYP
jgi:integrase/recombinase XerD